MGWFHDDVKSPHKSLEMCVNGEWGVETSSIDGSSHISCIQLVKELTWI
jgi:hypothetical protein